MRRAAIIALTAVALAVPASAQGAKVTATAAGVGLPDSFDSGGVFTVGEALQTFTLKGAKVKKKQVLDVNLVLNATTAPGVTGSLDDIRLTLIAPSGEDVVVSPTGQLDVFNWVALRLDDQSLLYPCDPEDDVSSRCNYGPDGGALTGTIHAVFNPVFRGVNAKGTWRLIFEDTGFSPPGAQPTAIGTTTLEVKTGKRFAKERK